MLRTSLACLLLFGAMLWAGFALQKSPAPAAVNPPHQPSPQNPAERTARPPQPLNLRGAQARPIPREIPISGAERAEAQTASEIILAMFEEEAFAADRLRLLEERLDRLEQNAAKRRPASAPTEKPVQPELIVQTPSANDSISAPQLDESAFFSDHPAPGKPAGVDAVRDWQPPPRPLNLPPALSISPAQPSSSDRENSPSSPVATPAVESQPSPEMLARREKIRDLLSHYYMRPRSTSEHSPWGCMHAMLPFGVDSKLLVNGRESNAIGWLCYNGDCHGQRLFELDPYGRIHAEIGPGLQGHAGQFLAMLAQSRVPKTYSMRIEGRDFTVADLIEYEQATCKENTELTFKLIGLVHYLPSDAEWTARDGQRWNIERLIREELRQKIVGAACGGNHRLTGFSYAVRKRETRKEPMDGQWLRAKVFLDSFHNYAFSLQNPSGSFSTDWYAGRADNGKYTRYLETTGHITEWLVYSLPESRLQSPEMLRSVDFLSDLLWEHRHEKLAIGPSGHALHALVLYDERVFGGKPGQRAADFATRARDILR
jgi:hypothetical protein